jgi:hypothetical protein
MRELPAVVRKREQSMNHTNAQVDILRVYLGKRMTRTSRATLQCVAGWSIRPIVTAYDSFSVTADTAQYCTNISRY